MSAEPIAPGPETPAFRYTAALANEIERRWQDRWEAEGTFHTPNPSGPLGDPEAVAGKDHLFILDMFPYPSGAGLHVGHPLGFIGTDVFGRYKRMTGNNVLHAMGFDAFGLPAEQHAIATGIHPRENTEANVTVYRRQLRALGLAHDDRRSVATTDESFYRWTQWIFSTIFNAWVDERTGRARHIDELIAEFASGQRTTPSGAPWADLSASEQRAVLAEHRLAYVSEAPVNWCPGLGTILANEEVTAQGRSDIGNFPVFKKNMRQWMMRITSYAQRLIDDLDRVDWPEKVKMMQRNWIGRSTGASVHFASAAGPITVFTTRPDTLFGATFMVLAPEHPLVDQLTAPEQVDAVAEYRRAAGSIKDFERQDDSRPKTGVPIGASATNPLNGEQIPIWIADYVLMGYGTGAIMAVPSGDQRDFEFARKFGLDIVAIQRPTADWLAANEVAEADATNTAAWPQAFVGDAPYANSHNETLSLDGVATKAEGIALVNDWLAANGHGAAAITYKLRDWLFSRQRYWGEPFPIVYDEDGQPIALPDSELPVRLPELIDFKPTALDPDDDVTEPQTPLSRATEWATVTLDLGDGPKEYRRELNVMPQWAGSCWYELRYLDPTNEERFVGADVERYWMGPRTPGATGGVDLYVGGVEHAVLHLLYSRFWHKVLFDLGHVSSEEPFHRLFNQGYIEAYAFRDSRGQVVPAAEVVEGPAGVWTWGGQTVTREYGKMGKSLKNVATPDEMYEQYGADTFRLYEMSMGPLDASRPWSPRDIVGMQRFLQRVWRNLVDETTGELHVTDTAPSDDLRKALHRTIDGVRADMDHLRINTAIAKLIVLNDALVKEVGETGSAPRSVAEPLVQMLSPMCPHVAEELWSRLGHTDTITYVPFPVADPALLVDDLIEIPVQVNGKVRHKVMAPPDISKDDLEALAMNDPKVAELLAGATPKKVIVVPGRMVNVVV